MPESGNQYVSLDEGAQKEWLSAGHPRERWLFLALALVSLVAAAMLGSTLYFAYRPCSGTPVVPTTTTTTPTTTTSTSSTLPPKTTTHSTIPTHRQHPTTTEQQPTTDQSSTDGLRYLPTTTTTDTSKYPSADEEHSPTESTTPEDYFDTTPEQVVSIPWSTPTIDDPSTTSEQPISTENYLLKSKKTSLNNKRKLKSHTVQKTDQNDFQSNIGEEHGLEDSNPQHENSDIPLVSQERRSGGATEEYTSEHFSSEAEV